MLSVIELELSNAVPDATGFTPFYVNSLTHPRVPLTLPLRGIGLGGVEASEKIVDIRHTTRRNSSAIF